MIILADAINSLRPGAQWHLIGTDYDGLNWLDEDQTKPTKQEVETELTRLQTEYDSNEYQRLRATEYPSIVDQLDTLYHSGLDAWKAQIKTVKDKYPKV
jgi:hypothetical protein